jgi:4'-phosphopantetheinyl transferase
MTPDALHLWTLALDTVAEQRWPDLAAVLDADEQARAARFHFERDRRAYVAAHALLRLLLAHVTGRPAEGFRFAVTEHGKPYLAETQLHVSLSHCRGMVAVAVTTAGEVGVDVEALDRRADPAIAERFFAPEEVQALRAVPDEAARAEHFMRLWTLKEAFIKALGKGLAQPLDQFAFVGLEPVRLVVHDPTIGAAENWAFWQHGLDGHVLALCVECGGAAPTVAHRAYRP